MRTQEPNNKKRYFRRGTIKPRALKQERLALIKKEKEEYLVIHKSNRHSVVKKYYKSKHFMKWTIKLLAPDFLIRHPNLWDNLKILRDHPQFRPFKMTMVVWFVFLIILGSMGFYSLRYMVEIFAISPVTDTFTDTTKIATSTQITVDTGAGQVKLSLWACGSTLTDSRDSKTYNTVLIGSQCWMAQYLNIGTRIAGASEQTNNASIEKYCYDDTESICTSDGGLYQWDEAMQYAASCNGTGESQPACSTPVRGICPAGWHMPSHYEYVALERTVCTSGTCATDFPYNTSTDGWRGTDEGTKLKVGGSSGWEGLLAGTRSSSGPFSSRGFLTYGWSSLSSGSFAWTRTLVSNKTTVNRLKNPKLFGFSIRCLQD